MQLAIALFLAMTLALLLGVAWDHAKQPKTAKMRHPQSPLKPERNWRRRWEGIEKGGAEE